MKKLVLIFVLCIGLNFISCEDTNTNINDEKPSNNTIENQNKEEEPTPIEEDDDEPEVKESPFVTALTDKTFDDAFKITSNWFIEFYAPWCGHCQELFPKFVQAAEKNTNKRVKFGKVDATVNKKLSDRFKIKGFPTLMFITKTDGKYNTKLFEYNREVNFLNAFVREQMSQSAQEIGGLDELNTFDPHESKAILVVIDKSDKHFQKTIEQIHRSAVRAGKDHVVYSNSEELRKHYKIFDVAENFVVDFSHGPEGYVFFRFEDKELDQEEFIKSLLIAKSKVLGEPNDSNMAEILDGPLKSIFLLHEFNNSTYIEETRAAATKVLNNYLGEFYTIESENKTGHIYTIVDALRVESSEFPVFIILDLPQNLRRKDDFIKYKLSGNGKALTEEQISNFMKDFKAGKLVNILSSDPIPDEKVHNGVETVVGLSIKDFANSPGRDALLSICTTLSVKCRKFTQIIERLATRVSNKTIAIGQIDFNNNEFEHIDFDQIPTVLLFKDNSDKKEKYNKESIVYYNGTSFLSDDLLDFIQKNAFNKIELVDDPKTANLTEVERLQIIQDIDNNEKILNITLSNADDDSDYKTDEEVNKPPIEEAEKDNKRKEEERQKEILKKEIDEEEPDLQEPEPVEQPELSHEEVMEEAKKGGMNQSSPKKDNSRAQQGEYKRDDL